MISLEEILQKQENREQILNTIRSRKHDSLFEQFSSTTLLDCAGTSSVSKTSLDSIILELTTEGALVKIRRDLFTINFDHPVLEVDDNYEVYPDNSEDINSGSLSSWIGGGGGEGEDKENSGDIKSKKRAVDEEGLPKKISTKKRKCPLATLPPNVLPL